MTTANRATKAAMWAERVDAWKASGESTEVFARGRGFSGSSLRNWTRRLTPSRPPRFLKLVPKAAVVVPLPTLFVEIGEAKVRVAPGFDASLLEEVIRALGRGMR